MARSRVRTVAVRDGRRGPLAVAVAASLAACHGGDPAGAGAADASSIASDGQVAADAALTGVCAADAVLPDGDFVIELTSGDRTRSARVHLPVGLANGPIPLVLNFHGYSNSATLEEDWSRMDAAADRDGYLVVYPEGTGLPRGFNAGACCGQAAADGVDDVAMTADLIDAVAARLCVDRRRVFATGFSNGGFLSHRLGCELSDRIAAIAPVSGVMGIDDCQPGRPMPVLDMHGDADPVVPYLGSVALGFPSVADTIDGWAERDGCGAATVSFDQGDARCELRSCAGGSEVELCTVTGGGHTWPGGGVPVGYTSVDLDADARMWAFFSRHPMPE